MKRISLIAPPYYGKSTLANIIRDVSNGIILKLASPLYALQKTIYDTVGINICSMQQDGELLQFLGHKIQRINPDYLFNEFSKKVDMVGDNNVIINDDCRPHNYQKLKELGFYFIFVDGSTRLREDKTNVDETHPVEWAAADARNKADLVIYNKGTIEELQRVVSNISINGIFN